MHIARKDLKTFISSAALELNNRGERVNNCMSPPYGPCNDIQLGLRKSANIIVNINTATEVKKVDCRQKRSSRAFLILNF